MSTIFGSSSTTRITAPCATALPVAPIRPYASPLSIVIQAVRPRTGFPGARTGGLRARLDLAQQDGGLHPAIEHAARVVPQPHVQHLLGLPLRGARRTGAGRVRDAYGDAPIGAVADVVVRVPTRERSSHAR